MVTPAAGGPARPIDAALRADAVDVLGDVLGWRLTERRWGLVAAGVDAIDAASRRHDVDAFRAAVYELELSGPTRAVDFGEEPMVEPPEHLVDRVHATRDIVYSLDGEPVPPPEY